MYLPKQTGNFYLKLIFTIVPLIAGLVCGAQQDVTLKSKDHDSTEHYSDSTKFFPAFIKAAADPELKGNGIKRFFIGKNYRKEWTEFVQVPVLDLKSAGFTAVKEGGGKETRSLKIVDKEGKGWSLRSVKKYPQNAIPIELRKTIAEQIAKDVISGSYPYGSLSIGVLSNAAHIPYLTQELVFIPDDPRLDKFREKYKNTLALMEDKEPAGIDLTILDSAENVKTISTGKVIYDLQKTNKSRVNQQAVLRARLLDNFVMDFDRHEGQWEWMKVDSDKNKNYYPIPKDRDQVFFIGQGLLPKLVKGAIPEIQGFRAKDRNPVTFNKAARNFDRYFMTELNERDWQTAIDELLTSMTDSVIEEALLKQPSEIHQYALPGIIRTLKEKRKYFKKDMMKYYKSLSGTVAIIGSNNPESFNVRENPDGGVAVTVKKINKEGNDSSTLYERVFYANATRELRIYGLEGNDKFIIEGKKSKIKIRMIGGPGKDEFINNAEGGKLWVYDLDIEQNTISGNKGIKNRISGDPMNNEYTRLGYKYNKSSPGINVEYAFDGDVYIGLKYMITRQGFRKEPFSSNQSIVASRGILENSYLFRYKGSFMKLSPHTDLLVSGEFFLPTSRTNFFGLGNETVFDKTKPGGLDYYRARYELGNFAVLGRTSITPWMDLKYGPSFQYFKLRTSENDGKYVSHTGLVGVNSEMIRQPNYYAGGEVHFTIDTKNDQVNPTRGAFINTYARSLFQLNGPATNLTQIAATFSLYTDFLSKKKLVWAITAGATHNIGDYQFPQAPALGFTEHLRGYRINRFAGRTNAYNNIELRWKIADVNAYFFPASFGMLAFNDVGRVWAEGEKSTIWHDGYGAGIWFSPLNKLVLTVSLSYSNEEKNLGLVTVGFQF